jgi:hypothetical protein
MNRLRAITFVFALSTFGAKAQTVSIDVTKPELFDLIGVKASVVEHRGKTALKLTQAEPGKARAANDPGTIAILRNSKLQHGEIELDLAGQPGAGASSTARGFVGVAFRVQGAGERYEYIYIRPTNGRAEDQVRRNHSVQYGAHPEYPWFRLRKEEPEKYESYADLLPGVWTKMKVVFDGTKARLYLHGSAQPNLLVNDLKLGEAAGRIALWIDEGTEAYFANLRVTSR